MSNCYDSCDEDLTRDLAGFEDAFEFLDEPCTLNVDKAKHRGLAIEEDWFDGNDSLSGYNIAKENHTSVPQPLPTKFVPSISTCTTAVTATSAGPPPLTAAAGFVSRYHLFCGTEADVEGMKKACVAACEAHDCVRDRASAEEGPEGPQQCMRFTHFSRAHFSIAFEVRVWSIVKASCCEGVLRGECPAGAAYVVEFHKVVGCSSRWMDLFSSIACTLLDGAGSQFFGRRPQPAPRLGLMLPEDDDDDDDELKCKEDMRLVVRMLSEGPPASQHAAVSSMVHHAVTKQACDQLVASGFLEAAFRIAADPMPHTTDLTLSQLTLLRCILLVASSVVTLSGTSAVAECGMGAFVASLHVSNPSVFTRDHAPLLEALQAF